MTNGDYAIRNEYSGPSSARPVGLSLSTAETIQLVRSAVEKAKEETQSALAQEEQLAQAVDRSVNVDLKSQSLSSLPDEAVESFVPEVERINLSHNQISTLPSSFSQCAAITYLNLRGNLFTKFPKPLLNLNKLQVLDLSRNRIEALPHEIQAMKSLRFLSVMHNCLESLPLALGYLESLRLLKTAGNPLNETLNNIVAESDSTPSPMVTSINDNEKDAITTIKIKQHLKAEAMALESGGESSESPLETPRPLKRNLSTSLRFPVVPNSSSESVVDLRELRTPGFQKPPVPVRSHFRMASGQNGILQNGSTRRPGISPLFVNNERIRSNSEGVLQATKNARSKRMGMMPKKPSELGTLAESNASRNSFHLRGFSHGSALKDKRSSVSRMHSGRDSSRPSSPVDERGQGTFMSRLSSVPELRNERHATSKIVEGAKGVLFSLHLVQPYIRSLLSMATDGSSKRSSLQRVFYNASTHIDRLDRELLTYKNLGRATKRRRLRATQNVCSACKACATAFLQVGGLLFETASQLMVKADQRYIRALLLNIWGSTIEGMNALLNVRESLQSCKSRNESAKAPPIPEEPVTASRIAHPSKELPMPGKRYRSDTVTSTQSQPGNLGSRAPAMVRTGTTPHSAVPLYINGRSRSSSRSNAFPPSSSNSMANTPRSGESFLHLNTPPPLPAHDGNFGPSFADQTTDALFERIFMGFNTAVSLARSALPPLANAFAARCEDATLARSVQKPLVDLWTRLLTRTHNCETVCHALQRHLGALKLRDPEPRAFSHAFWTHVTRFLHAFVTLADAIQRATAQHRALLAPLDAPRALRPLHLCVKSATRTLRESPWAYVLTQGPSPPPTAAAHAAADPTHPWPPATNGHYPPPSYLNGHAGPGRPDAPAYAYHRRARGEGGSGSSSSPHGALPTTPLSAALGPAAQAAMPASTEGAGAGATQQQPAKPPSRPTLFDRSFQGDVFQRAESLLSMPQTMLNRR